MIQMYEGDGKGKTTAAVGLAVRAIGRGVPVIFTQFLKDGSSGELKLLGSLPGVKVMKADAFYGFVFRMSAEEKMATRESSERLFAAIRKETESILTGEKTGEAEIRVLVVLDEVLHAIRYGFLDEAELIDWLKSLPSDAEVVLTGRNPSEKLIAASDYVSEISKKKHPFDEGVAARNGVEM